MVIGINNLASSIGNANTINPNSVISAFNPIATSGGAINGLPSSQVPNNRIGTDSRPIIHWMVPDFGVIKMYVNPRAIHYAEKKLINKEKTKGGFNLQYWGEELTTLIIYGTTGASGIEGINVLHEIYRAEQYAFDAVGTSLAYNNAATGAGQQILGGIGNSMGNSLASGTSVGSNVGGYITSSLFGTDPTSQALANQNIPSLAQYAFTVEMFYLGWIYRGYFDSMNFNEDANSLGLFEYDITFIATERRGYRVNNFPFQKSAVDGPSGSNVPYSFAGFTY